MKAKYILIYTVVCICVFITFNFIFYTNQKKHPVACVVLKGNTYFEEINNENEKCYNLNLKDNKGRVFDCEVGKETYYRGLKNGKSTLMLYEYNINPKDKIYLKNITLILIQLVLYSVYLICFMCSTDNIFDAIYKWKHGDYSERSVHINLIQ